MTTARLEPAPSAPHSIAGAIVGAPRPLVLGLDVDGVLAPIVAHANDARLTPGINDALEQLARHDDVHVAILSGRPVADLLRFEFPESVELIGSHGGERQGVAIELDAGERQLLSTAAALAEQAAERAGDGAWVETKPTGVVLHVREAHDASGEAASDWLRREGSDVDDLVVKSGSSVVELLVRHADKGTALLDYSARSGATTTVFFGDDITDEDAFKVLSSTDIGVKVGDAPTCASRRIADTAGVLTALSALADALPIGES